MKKNKIDLRYFSVLSDLLLHSIKTQQTNVSRTLSDFFYRAFREIRDKFTNEPVVYPDAYYELVYKAIEELAIIKEKRNYELEHRTSGELWLLGELQGKEISEKTYSWMWRNLLLAIRYHQDDLIVNHLETCHQYYNYSLTYIHQQFDNSALSFPVINQDVVDKRLVERKRFIEFHYALGGLLTYKERYSCIKRLFGYTQSHPPTYDLLPETMNEIFKFYFDVRDPYDRKYTWISNLYPFPELSGLNADNLIKKWISSYMAILFLRQWTIYPYLITMRPLDFPPTPTTQGEIKQWIDGLDFFKKLVNDHLQNKEMLKTLNLDFISPEWCVENNKPYPITFIEALKVKLETEYISNASNLPISSEKISQFEIATRKIIESAFDKLQRINNDITIEDENADKWFVNGLRMLQSKDAFSHNPEVHHLEFDSYLASVVSRSINEGLSEIMLRKTSKSFLLKPEDFFKGIDKFAINKDYVIVNFGINLNYFINQIKVPDLTIDKYKNIIIYSFNGSHILRDSLFVLKRSDLPNISTEPIDEDLIARYALKKISESINLYSSVIDLNNTSEEVFNENKQDKSEDEIRKSVLLSINISVEFKWKKNIDVIQFRQYSEFFQKGLPNKLDDIEPLIND